MPHSARAVVPLLDKLEKDRWNRMAKANLHLNERHRFRFVDILSRASQIAIVFVGGVSSEKEERVGENTRGLLCG